MPSHLTAKDLDYITNLSSKGLLVREVHQKLAAKRAARGDPRPSPETVRRALKGVTHARGKPERRGRNRVLTKAALKKVNKARIDLINEANGEREVRWADALRRARVPKVHR